MKAFSFRQPWGWAITDVTPPWIAKRIENRVWLQLKNGHPPIPLGQDFAIHVSATKPKEWDVDGVMSALDLDVLVPEATLASAIIGTAQIAMVLRCKEEQRNLNKSAFDRLLEQGGPWEIDPMDRDKFLYDLRLPLSTEQRYDQLKRWWIGPFAFVLDNVKKCKTPVKQFEGRPVKGALGFWMMPDGLHTLVQEQL